MPKSVDCARIWVKVTKTAEYGPALQYNCAAYSSVIVHPSPAAIRLDFNTQLCQKLMQILL